MSKRVSIPTGVRSGKLTALGPSDQFRRGCRLWESRCDCGNHVFLEPYIITGGRGVSCGCARKDRCMADIAGQRFGRLEAVERLPEKRGSGYLWSCRCDCGNMTVATVNQLRNGQITSCGCAKTEALKKRSKDIAGQRFGRLTALEPLEKRMQGSVMWRCRCDCGSECEASYNSLVSGNTRSCGCIKTEHEQPPLHYVDGTCVEMLTRKKLMANNTSGHTGVQATADGKWTARIVFKRKRYYLGTYSEYDDAVKARERAEEELFGGFLADYYARAGDSQYDSLPVSLDTGFNDKSRLRHNSSENQYKGKQSARILENEPRL